MGEARGLTYGLALGAGLMFVLDPRQGGARRALIRDKSVRAAREVEHAATIGVKDLGHRVEGLVARTFGGHPEPVSETVLVERVRARLGHVCSTPHAIQVHAKGHGEVELKGPIDAAEADRVLHAISHVAGVRGIDDDLQRVEHLPGVVGTWPSPLARAWTPTLRLALGVSALGVAVSSLLRGRPLAFGLAGASVLAIARNMVTRGGVAGAGRQVKRVVTKAGRAAQRVPVAGVPAAHPSGPVGGP